MKTATLIRNFPGIRLPAKALALVWLTLLLFDPFAYASGFEKPKKVLVLYSFRDGLPMNELIEKGIRSTFELTMTDRIELYMEYMDLSRFADDLYRQRLLDLYRQKYSNRKMDLVIPVNMLALSFLLKHGEELFPETPIVFCGVDKRELEDLSLGPNIAGVILEIEMESTLDVVLKLHPNTRHIAVVGGTSETDGYWLAAARQVLGGYEDKIAVTYLSELPMKLLLKKVADLPERVIIWYLTLFQDGAGEAFVPRDALALIARASNNPIYGLFDTYLGHGIVGGHLISFEEHGSQAAELGLRILRGENLADIPAIQEVENAYMFDGRHLKRWGISVSDLPPGSIVRYKEFSIWDEYKLPIIGLMAFCLIETLLIVILWIQRAKRRRAEEKVRESEVKYRTVADFTYDWEYWTNPDGTLPYVSPSCERISGYTTQEFVGNPSLFREIIVPEERKIWDKHCRDARKDL